MLAGGDIPAGLNEAKVAYLPKVVEVVAGVGATTAVGATRPIMLRNNASKFLWSVFPAIAADAIA